MFTEKTLREEIIKTWGPAGVHIEVYDKILKAAHANVFTWPLEIKIYNNQDGSLGSRIIESFANILYNKGHWHLVDEKNNLSEIPYYEIARLWPIMTFPQIIGKKGVYFNIKKK